MVIKVASPRAAGPGLVIAEIVAAQLIYAMLAHLAREHRRPASMLGIATRHPAAALDVAQLKLREGARRLHEHWENWLQARGRQDDGEWRPPDYPRLPSS